MNRLPAAAERRQLSEVNPRNEKGAIIGKPSTELPPEKQRGPAKSIQLGPSTPEPTKPPTVNKPPEPTATPQQTKAPAMNREAKAAPKVSPQEELKQLRTDMAALDKRISNTKDALKMRPLVTKYRRMEVRANELEPPKPKAAEGGEENTSSEREKPGAAGAAKEKAAPGQKAPLKPPSPESARRAQSEVTAAADMWDQFERPGRKYSKPDETTGSDIDMLPRFQYAVGSARKQMEMEFPWLKDLPQMTSAKIKAAAEKGKGVEFDRLMQAATKWAEEHPAPKTLSRMREPGED